MFLTRFHLDPRTPVGARALTDPQRLHATIYAAMPTQPVVVHHDLGRPLWRVDRDNPNDPLLWIVSPERPELDAFAGAAGQVIGGVVYESRSYQELLDRLDAGQVYAFRLAANAVHSGRRSRDAKDTQRFGHVTAVQQLSWLATRAEGHGFALRRSISGDVDAALVGGRRLVFWRDGTRVTISVSEFMGHLEIRDAELIRGTLIKGIGHARAYGCGLLTLAAPRRG